ncbi:UNVERIFIED_CONTAM: hypothetical protein LK11_31850 [Mumia flava]
MPAGEPVRVADLVAGLSRLADLGFGLPSGTALRGCALATRLARATGAGDAEVRATYYTALLHHVGCVGWATESAAVFGENLTVNRAAAVTDLASTAAIVRTFLPGATASLRPLARARATASGVLHLRGWGDGFVATACEVACASAGRLHLPRAVQDALLHVFDLWAPPRGAVVPGGSAIPLAARIARLAGIAVLFDELGGPEVAMQALERRSGGMLDPDLVTVFRGHRDALLPEEPIGVEGVLALEPHPYAVTDEPAAVARLYGELADLVSPKLTGHAAGVARLATAAGVALGLPDADVRDLEVAGWLADVGVVAVSNAVWDAPGRLDVDAWEQVRLHPYHASRIVAASPTLARLAPAVARHHEHLDGSGYPFGLTARHLTTVERVLAVAVAYRTALEPRPHRPAASPDGAAERITGRARCGQLDADAVRAVLEVAGHAHPARIAVPLPAGLSVREAEVLGLLARGLSNAAIAEALVISRRTAEHHVQHAYAKIGVSTRAAATLFAVKHDLLGPR